MSVCVGGASGRHGPERRREKGKKVARGEGVGRGSRDEPRGQDNTF